MLHSVVETADVLTSVTPSGIDGDADWFDFISDPDIGSRGAGDRHRFVRKGVELGHGARQGPQKVIATRAGVKRDLEAGINPEAILHGLALPCGRWPKGFRPAPRDARCDASGP